MWKVKVIPWHACAGTEMRCRCSSNPFLALKRAEWSAPCPGCFSPRKDPVATVQGTGWASGPVWRGTGSFAPQGFVPPIVQPIVRCYTDYSFDHSLNAVWYMGENCMLQHGHAPQQYHFAEAASHTPRMSPGHKAKAYWHSIPTVPTTISRFLLLLSMALQFLVQSFSLLNHFLPSSSILDKGLPIWHFQPLYIFFNIVLPAYLWSSCWPFLKWVSRSVLLWPFLFLAFFRYDHTILAFALWQSLLCSYVLLFCPVPD